MTSNQAPPPPPPPPVASSVAVCVKLVCRFCYLRCRVVLLNFASMGITTKVIFAGCLALMFGVPVDGLRESVDQHVAEEEARGDECCCLAFMESLETEPENATLSQESECAEYKLLRPDRPFWFHKHHASYKARCCWTCRWICNDFKEPHHRKPFSVDQYFHYLWCPKRSPKGTIGTVLD